MMVYLDVCLCEGNDNLILLTSAKWYKLKVELTAFDGSTAYAEYDDFKVASAADKYRLISVGSHAGTAGKKMSIDCLLFFVTGEIKCSKWFRADALIVLGPNVHIYKYSDTTCSVNRFHFEQLCGTGAPVDEHVNCFVRWQNKTRQC